MTGQSALVRGHFCPQRRPPGSLWLQHEGLHWWWCNFHSQQRHHPVCWRLSPEQHGLIRFYFIFYYLYLFIFYYLFAIRQIVMIDVSMMRKTQSGFKAQINGHVGCHMWGLIISLDKARSPDPLRARRKSAVVQKGFKDNVRKRFWLLHTLSCCRITAWDEMRTSSGDIILQHHQE